MESTDQWSNGRGSVNPKCDYEYQEMRGWGGDGGLATLFTPGSATGACIMCVCVRARACVRVYVHMYVYIYMCE